jgi:histidinol-phosphatase (PHP family)
MELPADSHVHSEFSWDTGGPDSPAAGRMEATCVQAERIGLGTVMFTDHLDITSWVADAGDFDKEDRGTFVDGSFHPLAFSADRYVDAIDRCRHRHPELRIMTGAEYGQPHLSDGHVGETVDLSLLDRVNGSLHTLPFRGGRAEPLTMYRHLPAEEVIWTYLAEVPRMIAGSDAFSTFTHIDYAIRSWPAATAGPFDPTRFEEGFRSALRAIADDDRALELNTRRLGAWIPRWWAEEGGRAVTFGSDAHEPRALAQDFPDSALLAEACGFRPGRRHEDPWTR